MTNDEIEAEFYKFIEFPIDDFTAEWQQKEGKLVDFKITKGASLYRLPWYRRIMNLLFGRSNWHHVKFLR